MSTCICTSAPVPFDHLLESHPKCIAHITAVRLVAAGWKRDGGLWTHEYYRGMWTEEQAKETLK